ncbi:MAG: hypothetical protein FH748_14540 [Balneolaceae bacterium]|nr:hypothetical protein [Balneolaceae bacterium]
MLFIDDQDRFASLLIMNGSSEVQEVTIEFPFGYPLTTDMGEIEMVYDDSVTANRHGISDRIRAFPRNFTLQPNQRQIVRLTIAPGNFEPGTYWSRIKTTSSPQSPPIGETGNDQVTTQITYNFEQITTVFYKKGNVTTGLNLMDISAGQNEDFIWVKTDLERTGNSPFLGSAYLTVIDDNGNEVLSRRTSVSIYFDYTQAFKIRPTELPAGEYQAEIRFVSQRSDIPDTEIVETEPVSQSITFTVR